MMKPLIILLFIVAGLISPQLHAADSGRIQHIEVKLTNELTQVARGFDPDAIVIVRVGVASVNNLDLPGTPFDVSSATLSGPDGLINIQSVTITILADKSKFPDEAQLLINKIASVEGISPQILYQGRPKGFKNPSERFKDESGAENDSSPDRKPIGEQVRDAIQNSAGVLGTTLTQTLYIASGIIAVAVAALIAVMLIISRQAARIAKHMSESGAATQNTPSEATPQKKAKSDAKTATQSSTPSGASNETIGALPSEAIVEIFADAYWSGTDEYASFLWKRLSFAQRKAVLSASAELAAYTTSLNGKPERDTGDHFDPFYLKGQKLHHISNEDLASLVRSQPSLLQNISKSRAESLPFTVAEWLELNRPDVNTTYTPQDFSKIKPSKRRDITFRYKFNKLTSADEEAIISLRDVDVSLMECVRSIAWASGLNGDPLSELLKDFTAQELAEALDGPRAAIDHILNHLPERKRQLTIEYLRQGIADRGSESFSLLFDGIIAIFRGQTQTTSGNDQDQVSDAGGSNVSAA